jgi:lipopolysaccharide/colanic/teichoic acid biosynthesis glycosyltransferase
MSSAPESMPVSKPARVPLWKRVFDITVILVTLPVVLPLMILVALIVRCVSAGPVLFRQERVGLKGEIFKCFKFRTMVVGNHAAVHKGHLTQLMDARTPMVKMDVHGDPRIIPMGVALRAAGLDELPQIFNVLFGDMSLVGPRPCVPYEYEKYEAWHKERFDVLPGLTGLWQVSGKNNTTFDEMMHLDIRYARNSSPWLDLAIIFKTIPALGIQMIETRRRRRLLEISARASKNSPAPEASPAALAVPAAHAPLAKTFSTVAQTDRTR